MATRPSPVTPRVVRHQIKTHFGTSCVGKTMKITFMGTTRCDISWNHAWKCSQSDFPALYTKMNRHNRYRPSPVTTRVVRHQIKTHFGTFLERKIQEKSHLWVLHAAIFHGIMLGNAPQLISQVYIQ